MRMHYPNVRLVKVVDGDTLRVDIDLGLHIWAHDQRIRLADVNAPELPTPDGVAAREALMQRLAAGVPGLTITGKDKYGRWLGIIEKATPYALRPVQ